MQEEHSKRILQVQQQRPSQASGKEETQQRQARGAACRAAPTAELLDVLEMGGGGLKSQWSTIRALS
jgi:hypothetical protein